MPNDTLNWKSKYLDLLDTQEAQEADFRAETALLKRALIRSSLAAEGSDEQLDQHLQGLRTLLRKSTSTDVLEQQIEQLEQAILKSEAKQQQRKTQLANTLTALIQQLQQLKPAKELQKALKSLAKNLDQQLTPMHNIAPLLQQFKTLQEQVLTTLQAEPALQPRAKPSVFARFFKPAPAAVQLEPITTHSLAADTKAADTVQRSTTEAARPADAQIADDAYALPLLMDASYSSVAEHIDQTLTALLDDLPVNQALLQQVSELQTRIRRGLNWYELAPLLDDLSRIILSITNNTDSALGQYLLELNQRLAVLHSHLQGAAAGYSESVAEAKILDKDLRLHVTDLHAQVSNSNDLNDLKKRVDSRLNDFISSLQDYQEKREHSETDIFARFHALAEHSKHMEHEAEELSHKLEEQRQQALLDPLTGLANRAGWYQRAASEHAAIENNNQPLLLSIIDIDHFKRINDSYGHLAGDKVLKIIAQELQQRLRKTDFIARFGGEEYALLLPNTPLADGHALLNSLRLAIAACPFNFQGEPIRITLSAGIDQVAADEPFEQAFERVDQALYAAKKAGRNQVHSAQQNSKPTRP